MSIVVVHDTETTGTEIGKDTVVQVAAVLVNFPDNGRATATTLFSSLANPGRPIPIEAQEVHKITDQRVATAPPAKWVVVTLDLLLRTLGGPEQVILVGHNSERFDAPLLEAIYPQGEFTKYRHIDTYNLALRMFPDAFNRFENPREYRPHRLERLIEWYVGKPPTDAHDAAADCHMTADILIKMLEDKGMTPDEAAEWHSRPEILSHMPYGKHGGLPFGEVPKGYLAYCRKMWGDTAKDVMASLIYHLEGGGA